MFANHSPAIHELLRERRLLTAEQLRAAETASATTGGSLAEAVVALGFLERAELWRMIGEALDCAPLAGLPESVPAETVAMVSRDLACGLGVMPIHEDERGVDVLTSDPFDQRAAENVRFALGREVRWHLGEPEQVSALIERHYGTAPSGAEAEWGELGATEAWSGIDADISVDDLQALAGQAPIVRFVNLVLGQAVRDHASDIHFEPFEHEFKIRYRIDGVLYEMAPPPKALALPITSRVKVLANLNIAERRVPQDGRIRLTLAGRAVDLRVSTLPTQFGESVVLRVLDQSAVQLELTQLGMPEDVLAGVQAVIRKPNGIFLVTGPTGSGKTTTLYSGLRVINAPDLKVLTAEDPVEYEIEGLMQVPVNPAAGLTFASALRSFLRQDPDVIMVGEIRDVETAQIAIQASLTGHLVLSTLHTNDAAGAVTRLIDLGIEPFLIAGTLEAVLAQRLVRRICAACREAYVPPAALWQQLGGDAADGPRTCYRGRGCAECSGSGYRGRLGIYEWLPVTEAIRERVIRKEPTLTIRQTAIEAGMRTLREDGRRAIFAGLTTIEEVVKYT